MFDAIARVLAFFYSLPVVGGSVGVAIILLTAAVMILLMPLTIKATKSTIKMQEVQPKLKELQRKHKDDKQTLNAELMALYQANGINPVGGCLPMVAQLPVFLVLFNVLRGLSQRVYETPYYRIAEHAREVVGGAEVVGDHFDPKYLSTSSDLYVDLSQSTEMTFGPFDLALRTLDVIQSNVLVGIPYVFLILFVVATSYYQQRQVSARRSGGMPGMNSQQEMILKAMPLLSGVWSFVFPAGLVVYWATSNTFRIGQQYYITRAFYADRASHDADAARGANGGAVSDDEETEPDDLKPAAGNARDGASASENGRSQARRSRSGPGARGGAGAASSNGKSAANDADAGSGDDAVPASREEAWAKRRQQKARANARTKSRAESASLSSRVTPKGTKPGGNRAGGNRKKRKR
jgi:YidC/Oxa1 family membrane protein insertase